MNSNIIKDLVNEELRKATEKFKPLKSTHEGYAVILEEIDELYDDIDCIKSYINKIWVQVKANNKNVDTPSMEYSVEYLYSYALLAIKEAIQVAAMAKRFQMDIFN